MLPKLIPLTTKAGHLSQCRLSSKAARSSKCAWLSRWQSTASAYKQQSSAADHHHHYNQQLLYDGRQHATDSDRRQQTLSPSMSKFTANNEPQLDFSKLATRQELDAALDRYKNVTVDVPIVIGDQEIYPSSSDNNRNKQDNKNMTVHQLSPSNHAHKVARFAHATPKQIEQAISTAIAARRQWERLPVQERVEIFLNAANLMAQKYRMDLLATTVLGQGKTCIQAEIDAACELIDFLRFNCQFALDLTMNGYQPLSTESSVNTFRYRGLEGFVAAISPFNFTAIGGNLATAPALMGNVVVWKPSDTAVLSNYTIFKILREAGVPAGVINFLPSDGKTFGKAVVAHKALAGINFTGSVPTFRYLWSEVSKNLETYLTFPRIIGEVGGKNFHLIHKSADVESAVNATIRGAFEYSGQKCSACSRLYVPQSLWNNGFRDMLISALKSMKVDSPLHYDTFMSAVIDEKSFDRITKYIDSAKHNNSEEAKILCGGEYSKASGYYVQPTVIQIKNPKHKLMQEEIFGPVLTVFVYDDNAENDDNEKLFQLITTTSPFGLTGAVFARDAAFIATAADAFKDAVGNFYINDKCTGAVVNQQPFGGARLSGTNDKAGGPHYLLRWSSPQSIKETRMPTPDWKYPYMTTTTTTTVA